MNLLALSILIIILRAIEPQDLRNCITIVSVLSLILLAIAAIVFMAVASIDVIISHHSFCDTNQSQCPEW